MLIYSIITDWVQAVSGFATLGIAIITYLQGRRIKTLTDVVDELKGNNKILERRFTIERIVTMMERMPYFKLDHRDADNESGKVVLHLHNIGLDATDLQIMKNQFEHYNISIENKEVLKGKFVKIVIDFHRKDIENVDFFISAKSFQQIEVWQRIHKFPGYDFVVESPEDFI